MTVLGRQRLLELQLTETREAVEMRLRSLLRPTTVKEVLDLLIARRSLERQSCREAAANASDDEIAELRHYVSSWPPTGDVPGFHGRLANLSGNGVLAALVALLTIHESLHKTLRSILTAKGVLADMDFHEKVVVALERRDPDLAEAAVLDHFDRMISAVGSFGAATSPETT